MPYILPINIALNTNSPIHHSVDNSLPLRLHEDTHQAQPYIYTLQSHHPQHFAYFPYSSHALPSLFSTSSDNDLHQSLVSLRLTNTIPATRSLLSNRFTMPPGRQRSARVATSPYPTTRPGTVNATNVGSSTSTTSPITVRSPSADRIEVSRAAQSAMLQAAQAIRARDVDKALPPNAEYETIRNLNWQCYGSDPLVSALNAALAAVDLPNCPDDYIRNASADGFQGIEIHPAFPLIFSTRGHHYIHQSFRPSYDGSLDSRGPQSYREVIMVNTACELWLHIGNTYQALATRAKGDFADPDTQDLVISIIIRARLLATAMKRTFLQAETARVEFLIALLTSKLRATRSGTEQTALDDFAPRVPSSPQLVAQPASRSLDMSPSSPTVATSGPSAAFRSAMDRRVHAIRDPSRAARRLPRIPSSLVDPTSPRPAQRNTDLGSSSSPLQHRQDGPRGSESPTPRVPSNRDRRGALPVIQRHRPSSSPQRGPLPPHQGASPPDLDDDAIDDDSGSVSSRTTATVLLDEEVELFRTDTPEMYAVYLAQLQRAIEVGTRGMRQRRIEIPATPRHGMYGSGMYGNSRPPQSIPLHAVVSAELRARRPTVNVDLGLRSRLRAEGDGESEQRERV